MGNELIEAFANESVIASEDLVSLNIGYKKRTGERFAKAVTAEGKTYIKTLSKTGIETQAIIAIPPYNSREERDAIIRDLSQSNTQDDIADMLGISQSTVSNTLRKNQKK